LLFSCRAVSLFDLETRFLAPTHDGPGPSRAGAVKVGRRANVAPRCIDARPYLDSSEHDGTLGPVGMTITRKARCRTRLLHAAALYSVGRQTHTHDARMRIGGEAPRRQAHSAQRHESQGFCGSRHLESSSAIRRVERIEPKL
jgi:hypothetical protein